MLQKKVYICCKTLSNRIQIQNRTFKKLQTEDTMFFTQGDHRKSSKVMKVFRVKRTTVTSTA